MEDRKKGISLIYKRLISIVYRKLKEGTVELLVPITNLTLEAKANKTIYLGDVVHAVRSHPETRILDPTSSCC